MCDGVRWLAVVGCWLLTYAHTKPYLYFCFIVRSLSLLQFVVGKLHSARSHLVLFVATKWSSVWSVWFAYFFINIWKVENWTASNTKIHKPKHGVKGPFKSFTNNHIRNSDQSTAVWLQNKTKRKRKEKKEKRISCPTWLVQWF